MKKSKRLIGIILAAVMLLTTVQAAFIVGAAQTNSIKVATISDIRYQANAADKEGLLLSKSAAMLDAAIAKVKKSDADVLLVTGDLTNNGNKSSHEYVADKLREVKAEGIPVFVIPGEHDVREGGTVTAISKNVFEGIYKDLGYSEPKQDASSASYVAELGNKFAVVMSDSVAPDGQGQMPQWVVDEAKSYIGRGYTVFAASHHPIVTRGSVDRTLIDLLYTLSGVEVNLGGKFRIFTENPNETAKKLGLVDRSCVLSNSNALIDAGVKYLFSGHGGTLSVAGATTTNGGQLYDIMSGSLVNASSSVRYTTLYKATANMKEQRAEFTTDMITEANGVSNVEKSAHAVLKKQMPREVDYAINKAEKVITYIIPAMKPNIQRIVRELDFAALVPDMAGLMGILGGTIQNVKNDVAGRYIGPLFDILGNPQKLHNIIVDIRSALEKMDFNGQDLYGFLTDVFVTIQKGDGKAPASVEGIFQSIRDKDPALLSDIVNSFADNFNSANLVSLLNEVLDHHFYGKYVGTLHINIDLRGLLAGPYNITSGIYTYTLDLWNMLDTSVVLPNGKKVSQLIRPLVNDLILGGPNDAKTKQTPQRFNANLRKDSVQIVNLLFEFNVGDMIGSDVFAQGQRGAFVAKTITLEELGANLQKLVPDNNVQSLNPADWAAVRDTLNAAGRFTSEQLASVNKVLVPADTVNNIPAVTQLDKLKALANAEFYKGVALDFTNKVNALPPIEQLTLEKDADTVYTLQNEYVQFYSEIKSYISPAALDKLNKALKKIGELENYDPAVEEVIKKIDDIGEPVTVESEAKINIALDAYNNLDVRQRKHVTNYQKLVDAQSALKLAKENAVIIKAVEDKIDDIGTVENNSASKIKIDMARRAYENLDKALQPNVKNYQKLVDAENRYNELKAHEADLEKAQPVIDMIKNIGVVNLNSKFKIENAENAYGSLTENQQKLVTNYEDLVKARQTYDSLILAQEGENAKIKAVEEKISDIGVVTVGSGAKIKNARNAYEELNEEQREKVKNYLVLQNAEKTYEKLLKDKADLEKAQEVEKKIAAIGSVTVEKADLVAQAREAYNRLTSDQRRLVKNFSVLTDAEALLSVLKNDFKFEDGATGIIVRADSGVVPTDTVMTVRQIKSGSVYDAIMNKGYKAIHLYDIKLESAGNKATPKKDITISIPQFALNTEVLAVASNGKLVPVNASLERGSFTFKNADAGMFVVAQKRVCVNTENLAAAIEAYEKLDPKNFDTVRFAKAEVAYEAAKAELEANYEFTSANQRRIEAAANALNDAIDGLAYLPLDAKLLKSAIYEAKMLNPDDYADFTAVAGAVAQAEAFLAGDTDARYNAKAAELANNIKNAVLALKLKDADFTLIEKALANVPKDLQNYTDDSVAALKRAIEDAKKAQTTITRKDKEWKSKVEAKAKAIDDAANNLVPVGETAADTENLKLAISITKLYYPADYVDFSGVEGAVLSAEALFNTHPTAKNQAEVDNAEMAIYEAINTLTWA